jgi:hypothetical protein
LHPTTQRLGAAAVSSESCAAHNNSNFHSQFMRASAAVAPNRKLDAGECQSRIPILLFTDIERFLTKCRHFLMMHHHFLMIHHHFLMMHHYFLMMHHYFLIMHHYFLMISPSLFDDASLLFDGITITF